MMRRPNNNLTSTRTKPMRTMMRSFGILILATVAALAAPAPSPTTTQGSVKTVITLEPGDMILGNVVDPVAFSLDSIAKQHPLLRVGVTALVRGSHNTPDVSADRMLNGAVLLVPVAAVESQFRAFGGYRALASAAFLGSSRLVGELRDGEDGLCGMTMQGIMVSGGYGSGSRSSAYVWSAIRGKSKQAQAGEPVEFVVAEPTTIDGAQLGALR